jgi:hypothetical protein
MQVLGLTTALGCISGTSAPAFAVALVFSMVSSASQLQHPGHNASGHITDNLLWRFILSMFLPKLEQHQSIPLQQQAA